VKLKGANIVHSVKFFGTVTENRVCKNNFGFHFP